MASAVARNKSRPRETPRPAVCEIADPAVERFLRYGSGVSIHRGVLVIWDADFDRRVLGVIDDLPERHRRNLLAIHEHNGGAWLVWRGRVPRAYREGEQLLAYDLAEEHIELWADAWIIVTSVAVAVAATPDPWARNQQPFDVGVI